ncbi:MAG TPA: aminotransferase class V-fold PLP-dependent enzyme [Drouetiella sp.]
MAITSIQLSFPALSTPSAPRTHFEGKQQPFELSDMRDRFPILRANPNTLFFDNAATSQKPIEVLEKIEEFNRVTCANAGRGEYSRSTRLYKEVEASRVCAANFLNADPTQVAFTSGATESLNLVATMWGLENLRDGDKVVLCAEDHASAVLPWHNLKATLQRRGIDIQIKHLRMHYSGTYDRKSLTEALSARTRVVCLTHIHHLYGMEMDIAELKSLIPKDVFISLDASQSVSHIRVDSGALGVDFISFSGHKMFAGNGVGVLWASDRALKQMWPVKVGAKTKLKGSGDSFQIDRSYLSNIVECGTLNLPAILSLKPAIEFIELSDHDRIGAHLSELTLYLLAKLQTISGIEFAPGIGVCRCTRGYGIISFRINDVDSRDIGAYLDSENIFVKTGDQCTGSQKTGNDFVRVSLQIYNNKTEIDKFVEVLNESISS